jgi:hypothetical protein
MVTFLMIIILGLLGLLWIEDSVSRYVRKKNWIKGENYNPNDFEQEWHTAMLKGDRDKIKYRVRYEPDGDYFVDSNEYAYLPRELYIKKEA